MGLQPLDHGEHVDLDTGTKVKRGRDDGNLFHLTNETGSMVLEDVEIEWLAQLAGYEVTDGD